MGKINWTRVITGGLLAGLVVNIVEGGVGSLFMEDTTAQLEAHGLSMDMGGATMVFYLLMGFVYGIVAVWFYAQQFDRALILARKQRLLPELRCGSSDIFFP